MALWGFFGDGTPGQAWATLEAGGSATDWGVAWGSEGRGGRLEGWRVGGDEERDERERARVWAAESEGKFGTRTVWEEPQWQAAAKPKRPSERLQQHPKPARPQARNHQPPPASRRPASAAHSTRQSPPSARPLDCRPCCACPRDSTSQPRNPASLRPPLLQAASCWRERATKQRRRATQPPPRQHPIDHPPATTASDHSPRPHPEPPRLLAETGPRLSSPLNTPASDSHSRLVRPPVSTS